MFKGSFWICLAALMAACDGDPPLGEAQSGEAQSALVTPSIQSLGAPAGAINFTPTSVNRDGSFIVGNSIMSANNSGSQGNRGLIAAWVFNPARVIFSRVNRRRSMEGEAGVI